MPAPFAAGNGKRFAFPPRGSGFLGPVSRDSTEQEGRCRNSLRLPRPDDSARGLQMPNVVRQEAVEALPPS
jgi:hypothetical protein